METLLCHHCGVVMETDITLTTK